MVLAMINIRLRLMVAVDLFGTMQNHCHTIFHHGKVVQF